MPINFPSSPSNNQLFVTEGKAMRYNATKNRWKAVSTLSSSQITDLEARTIGVSSMSISGNTLVIQKDDSSYANVSLASFAGNKLTTYANASILPLSDLVSGTQVYVEDTDSLYITDGSGWYKIATVNLSPSLTLGVSSISLGSGGSIDVNYTVNEPEDTPYTVSASATSNATITVYQANNTITFDTPVAATTETITITATDGVNSVGDTLTMTINLGPNWAATLASPTEVLISTTQTQNDSYGQSVAIVGNTAVVGTGASVEGVDVYSKSSGSWTHVQKVLPTDTSSGDQFGLQVLVTPDENNIIVSSPGQSDGQTMAGKVYTFSKSGSTWSQSSSFQAPNPQDIYSTFGRTILLSPDGTTLAVGQPGYDGNSNQNTGRMLIYTGSGSSWTYRTFILPATATNQQIGGHYGSALSNDTLAFQFGNGGVYVYTGSGASWSQQQLITESSPTALNSGTGIYLGSAIAISGDNLALGASGADSGKGAVFVYTRSGSTWSLQQKLQPSGILAGEGFGYGTLRFHPDDADIIFASASTTDSGSGNTNTGSVFIFQRSGSTWSQINRIDNPGYNGNAPAGQSNYGISHAVSNADLLIGAPQQHTNSSNPTWNTGGAYFYEA